MPLFDTRFTLERVSTPGATLNVRRGGDGPPLLLLHGFPQTHAMWHAVASALAGHDRGARVTHRLALDHPACVERACVMDIVPTRHLFTHTDQVFATAYYHWFFLIQPDGLPEKLIGADPGWYLRECMRRWAAPGACFDAEAVAEYERCYAQPATIHSTCEDYRAGASIDLEHDAASSHARVECPLLVLWGARGFVQRHYAVLDVWRQYANDVRGEALDCGHFVPEERPAETVAALSAFMLGEQ